MLKNKSVLIITIMIAAAHLSLRAADGVLDGQNDAVDAVTVYSGRYGNGRSRVPDTHMQAAREQTLAIIARDAVGAPSENGRIVVACFGIPESHPDTRAFINSIKNRKLAPSLLFIECTQPKAGLKEWASGGTPWNGAASRLGWFGAAKPQVQIAWVHISDTALEYDRYQDIAAARLIDLLVTMKREMPNLTVVYLTSGRDMRYERKPEPYCYRFGYTIRSIILEQIAQNPNMNYDRSRGAVRMPLLLWGPDDRMPSSASLPGSVLGEPGTVRVIDSDRGHAVFAYFLSDPAGSRWLALNVRD